MLAAACCSRIPRQQRVERIRSTAQGVSDWDRFVRIVQRHRIDGLVRNGLNAAGVAMPEIAARSLARAADRMAHQSLRYAAETVRLHKLFKEAGNAALFIKGATLAVLAYNEIGIKHAWDIDVLVSPEASQQASALLEAAGYKRVMPPPSLDVEQFQKWVSIARECMFENLERGTVVELHWRLAENPMLLPDISAKSPCQWVALSRGQSVCTLANEELFSYLCVHGAAHGWARLKWLADVGALLSHLSETQIETWYRASQEHGAGRCSAQALLLCERLLGQTLPGGLAAELRRDRKVRWLEQVALNAMAGGDGVAEMEGRVLASLSVRLSYFLFGYGWRYGLMELRSNAVGWTDSMRFPLPKYLRFLYPIVRIPSWLWRRVILRTPATK